MNIRTLIRQNRNLSARIAELEATVKALEAEVANRKGATRKLHIELIDCCGRNQILTEQVKLARGIAKKLATLAKHAKDCSWATSLPTENGVWGCSCGLGELVLDGELMDSALAKLQGADWCAAQTLDSAVARLIEALQVTSTEELDEGHPLWCLNEQIKGLLEGHGASEDHDDVLKFFRSFGLPETTVKRIHEAICCSRDTERLNVIERKGLHVCADAGFDEDITCQVFEMTGNRNDREWNLIGRGETLREAIDNARKGLK